MVKVAMAVLVTLFAAGLAAAQGLPPEPSAFRVEWERRDARFWRPAVEGYVYNESDYRVGNVRLRVEVVDASGHRLGGKTVWVPGAIDARGRGYFMLPPPEVGQAYRIAVESFDLLARQTPRPHEFQAP